MKNLISTLTIAIALIAGSAPTTAFSQEKASPHHEMQHGFILSDSDQFASHLVANGHHSRQVDISGELTIKSNEERIFYLNQKTGNLPERKTYFLFQAQNIDLPSVQVGQVLSGHIIESKVGDYEPKNIIVREATFVINAIHINIANPFFE